MVKAIIFDFYGVICPDLYWTWLKTHVPDIQKSEVHEYFMELSRRVDRAEISAEEFHQTVAQRAGTSAEQVLIDWKNEVVLNRELLNYIAELKTKNKIGLLSNANFKFIESLLKDNDLEQYFDAVVISSRVGYIKPQAEIFELTLQQLEVDPDQAVFVDDNSANVLGAQRLGIKGIVYISNSQLKQELGKVL